MLVDGIYYLQGPNKILKIFKTMIKFKSHDELKEIYDTHKYDIFYEDAHSKYFVSNIGSSILCRDEFRGYGNVEKFNIDNFYGEEKKVEENENMEPSDGNENGES